MNYSIIALLCFALIGCGSQKKLPDQKKAYEVINQFMSGSEKQIVLNKNSYYKNHKGENWGQYINFPYLSMNYALEMGTDRKNFKTIFTQEDLDHMKKQVRMNKSIKWKKESLLERIKFYKKSVQIDNNETYLQISYPVFSIDKDYALFIVEYSYSGMLYVYNYENDKWQLFTYVPLWISEPVVQPRKLK